MPNARDLGRLDPRGFRMTAAAPAGENFKTRYLQFLLIVIGGYAIFGKGFAYVGYPPLLIGEIALALGLWAIFTSRAMVASLASLPSLLVLAFFTMVVVRVSRDLPVYGLNAARDGVIGIYAIFTFVVIALMLDRPERLKIVVRGYAAFIILYGVVGPIVPHLSLHASEILPAWPHVGVRLIQVRLGEASVHLAAAAVFVLLGLRRAPVWWIVVLAFGIAFLAPSRAAFFSAGIAISVAAVLGNRISTFLPVLLVGLVLFGIGYVANINIELEGGRRIGPQQIVDNIESVVGESDTGNLDGTKEWRLAWWRVIVEKTIFGPFFWEGRGFGQNLAVEDGFVVGLEDGGPILRSPHNIHLTVLARLGVPGAVLWAGMLLVWFSAMFHAMAIAKRRAETRWAALFIWVSCYVIAVLLNASFDVAIEGPMQGIPFWCLIGFGIAMRMIYLHQIRGAPPTADFDPFEDPAGEALAGRRVPRR